MKALLIALTTLGILVGATAPAVKASTSERRVALVVGNARYADAPLKNPANDARAMAATLRERGFEVILRTDATKPQMEAAIIEFGEKLTEGATGVFFYAGHGIQVQGRNYVIPTDAKLTAEQRVKLETVDVDAVLDQMQGARSKVNVVILDACRNNPFERRFRSSSGGLAQINAPEGTLIAYATAPGRVAADGEGENGLYTSELLKALKVPGLKVEDVFKQVRINVTRISNGAQTPWEASSLVGDFFFLPPPPPTPAPAPIASTDAADALFWDSIRGSSAATEIQAYLNAYPQGRFAALAQARLALLQSAPPVASVPTKPAGALLDGRYSTTVSGASWTTGDFPAYLEIKGTEISGYAVRIDQPRPCSVTGRITSDGAQNASIRIHCDRQTDREVKFDALTVELIGNFVPSADEQDVVGETTFRSSDRRTGKATWRRMSDTSDESRAFRRWR